MRRLSIIMCGMGLLLSIIHQCATQIAKMSRQLKDNDHNPTNVAAHSDGMLSCEGTTRVIGCRKIETNEGLFYLFVAVGSTFGLLGMFLSVWMACRYVNRTYVPRDERLLHAAA